MNLNDELREMMLTRAEEAPDGAALLDGVRTRSRRLEVRRRVATLAIAALAAATIAVVAPYALGAWRGDAPIGETPTPSAGGIALGPPTYELPAFPLTPGWRPTGVEAWTGLTHGTLLLGYLGERGTLLTRVGPERPSEIFPSVETRTTSVGSAPATLRTGTADGRTFVDLTWQLPDGRWVDVVSISLLTAGEVERFARELSPVPMPAIEPKLSLALVPVGYELAALSDGVVCLGPAGSPAGADEPLCVRTGDMSLSGGGESLTVGGHPAEILDQGTVVELRVILRAGVTVIIAADKTLGLTTTDLTRIAEGVTVNGITNR